MHPLLKTMSVAALAALTLSACGGDDATPESRISAAPEGEGQTLPTGGSGAVDVASADFAENQILAEIYAQALSAAGYDASVTPLTTRPNIIAALQDGAIDVEPDYVGALTEYFNLEENGPDAALQASGDLDATLELARGFAETAGLTVLTPSPAADQNAFAVTEAFSEENGITTLSELAEFDGPLTLGGSAECQTYTLCLPGLEQVYGLELEFMQTDIGGPLTVSALQGGTVQVNQYLSSDGTAPLNGFVVLEDDQNLAVVDNVVPVVGEEYGDDALLAEVLDAVSASMTTEDLVNLNASVSLDRVLPAQAARDYLIAKGLIAE